MSLASFVRLQPVPGAMGAAAPQISVAPTDVTGPIMAEYQAKMAGWQADQNKKNALMGALFGLGGSALGGWAHNNFPAFWR